MAILVKVKARDLGVVGVINSRTMEVGEEGVVISGAMGGVGVEEAIVGMVAEEEVEAVAVVTITDHLTMLERKEITHHHLTTLLSHTRIFHRYRSNIRHLNNWFNNNSSNINSISNRCRARVLKVVGTKAAESYSISEL